MAGDRLVGQKIRELRRQRRENQEEFSRVLRAGRTQVSEYESGSVMPSAEMYLRLGNLAPYPQCLFFYERAGMDMNRIAPVADALQACLKFVRSWDQDAYQRLERNTEGFSREEKLARALQCMAVLPGLGDRRGRSAIEDVLHAFVEAVRQVDPKRADELKDETGQGSGYDKIKWMHAAATEAKLAVRPQEEREREQAYIRSVILQRKKRKE
jgi:transcriptional regulator with XRE-family HTH domain